MAAENNGALVISLDFELHWGVRDHRRLECVERQRLLLARQAVPRILDAFYPARVRATWATVGFLFAHGRAEAEEFQPALRPGYADQTLNPYREVLGRNEDEDPFHFAPSLIAGIAKRSGQEIASHSFSHYYALEAGQTREQFEADLNSAVGVARRRGHHLRSYVFPRNQVKRGYLDVLKRAGFSSYRGNEPAPSKAAVTFNEQRRPVARALRLADAYCNVHGQQTIPWPIEETLAAVDGSRYLRPFSPGLRHLESVRLERIAKAMRSAAREKRIYHLWWHPEDFAYHTDRNIDFLNRVLRVFEECRKEYGMQSLNMADISERSVGAKATTELAMAAGSGQ